MQLKYKITWDVQLDRKRFEFPEFSILYVYSVVTLSMQVVHSHNSALSTDCCPNIQKLEDKQRDPYVKSVVVLCYNTLKTIMYDN